MSEHSSDQPDDAGEWQAPDEEAVEPLHPPTVEEQKTSLAAVQMDHMDQMRESGLMAKAAAALNIEPGTAQFMSSRGRTSEGEMVFRVTTGHYEISERGQESRGFRHVDVGRTLGDTIVPASDLFSFDDAELAAGFVAELDELRDSGVLPNLDAHGMSIFDPSTAIRKME